MGVLFVGLVLLQPGGKTALAQPAEAEAAPAADAAKVPTKPPPPAGPDTSIWIDDSGTPRPLVGVTYDEFAKAWRAYQGLEQTDTSPRYTIESIAAKGQQLNGHAAFEVRLKLLLHTKQRVEAPLGFGKAILDEEQPTGLQENDTFGYSEHGESYVATLVGGGERLITLKLLVPITTTGQRNELTVAAPRANLSELSLQLTGKATEPAAPEGALLRVSDTEKGSVLTLQGGVGRVRLQWRSPEQASASAQTVLTSVAEITSEIDSGSVRTRARLTVQSSGGEFERFRVRLPPGAKMVTPPNSEAVSPVRVQAEGEEGDLCLVTLPEKTAGPVTVDIYTDQAIGLGGSSLVDLAGFEVLGAVRQHGDLAIKVDEDSQLRWGDLHGARRIALDQLPETLRGPGVTAAVRYFRQKCQIVAEVLQLGSRIETTPQYRLEILPNEALLRVTTRYQIIGAPELDFSFKLDDWLETPEVIETAGQIDLAHVLQSDAGILDIPFTTPQAGPVVVRFNVRKSLPVSDGPLNFTLPAPLKPVSDFVGKPELLVVVHPGLSLSFDPKMLEGLVAEPVPADRRPPDDPDGLRTFLFRGNASLLADEPLRFIATKTSLPGESHVRVTTRLEVDQSLTRVLQTFRYDLRRQPRERVEMIAPSELLEGEGPRVELVSEASEGTPGQETAATPLSWSVNVAAGTIVIDLPRPWIGPLFLRSSYNVARGADDLGANGTLRLPLLTAANATTLQQTAHVTSAGGVLLTPGPRTPGAEPSDWSIEKGAPGAEGLVVTSARQTPWLPLVVAAPEALPVTTTVVMRQWHQTWRRPQAIQQRSAWRIATDEQEVFVSLPPGVASEGLETLVDGVLTRFEAQEGSLLRIGLSPIERSANREPSGESFSERTIEIKYLAPTGSTPESRVALRPAQLRGDDSAASCYWQVIVPRDRWLLSPPPSFGAAWRIAWQDGRFRRRQEMSAEQLEKWVGAAPQGMSLAEGEHAYLFSSLDVPRGDWRVTTIDRNLTALVASTVMLAIGLLVAYAPGRWRTAGVALASAAIAFAGVMYPGELALAAQAGMIGLAALLVGWLTMLTLGPRHTVRLDASGDSTALRQPSASAETSLALELGGVSTNAPTVSMETSNPIP